MASVLKGLTISLFHVLCDSIFKNKRELSSFISCNLFLLHSWVKDTHREKAPSNETPALTKSTNMGICVVRTSNQLFTRGS